MKKMKRLLQNCDGAASIVEYSIVLPLCFLVIAFIFLLGFYLNQKAVIDSVSQRSLIVAMKMFNDPSAEQIYDYSYGIKRDQSGMGSSSYDFSSMTRDPYRYWKKSYNQQEINSEVESFVAQAVANSQVHVVNKWASPAQAHYEPGGGLLGNNITVTVKQEYTLVPIVFLNLVGIDKTTIVSTSKMNVINQTEFIRNTNFACDMIEEMGGRDILNKVAQVMNSITKFFSGEEEGE